MTGFTFEMAAEICVAPFVERERRAEAARLSAAEGEAARAAGVGWSGLGPDPARLRSPDEVRADALAACARAQAFAESPRGALLLALRALQDLGWAAQAEAARAAFARGFADPGRPPRLEELACALAILGPIDHAQARAACRALAILLGGPALACAAE
jgi:hypothetical protein